MLVHRDRWPQKKLKAVESQWFGPYQVLEVRHSSLKIRVSLTLGGEAVGSLQHIKHWRVVVDHDQEIMDPNSFQPDLVVSDDDEDVEDLTNQGITGKVVGVPLEGTPR